MGILRAESGRVGIVASRASAVHATRASAAKDLMRAQGGSCRDDRHQHSARGAEERIRRARPSPTACDNPRVRGRWTRWLFGALYVLLGAVLLGVLFFPMSVGCGRSRVRVTGRLLDKETGRALVGAWVMCFPSHEEALDEKEVADRRGKIEAWRLLPPEQRSFFPPSVVGGSPSDADGRFDFLVSFAYSETTVLIGISIVTEDATAGDIAVLRVEIAGRPPVLVEPDPSGWNDRPAGGDAKGLRAVYDLGEIAVAPSG